MRPTQGDFDIRQHDVPLNGERRRDMAASLVQHDPGLVRLAAGQQDAGLPEHQGRRQAGVGADRVGQQDPLQGPGPAAEVARYQGAQRGREFQDRRPGQALLLGEGMGSLRRVLRAVHPRPVALDERRHTERLELETGQSVAFGFRSRLVQQRADVLVPAVPQMGARLRQQHRRPQPRHDGCRCVVTAAQEAIRGRVHRPQVAGLLPENEFDQVRGRK